MDETVIARIEADFRRLSRPEQARVLKRLQSQLDLSAIAKSEDVEAQLAAMAADPAIRGELRKIEAEFGIADADGLTDE